MSGWSKEEEKLLQEKYPSTPSPELEQVFERSSVAINTKANRMGLSKESTSSNYPRQNNCSECGEEYTIGESSWKHTDVCRACYDRVRRMERKRKIIEELFEGECEICGYSGCQKALTFHHINPDEKEMQLSDMLRRSWDIVVKEAKKCKLLCSNCHNTLHCENCGEVAE